MFEKRVSEGPSGQEGQFQNGVSSSSQQYQHSNGTMDEKSEVSQPEATNALYASRYENKFKSDSTNTKSSKRKYAILAGVVLLVALALAAALVVYIVVNESDDDDDSQATNTESITLQLITKDDSLAYDENMADPTSDDFKNVEDTHCAEVEEALEGSDCKVLSITEGSVITESVVDVFTKTNQSLAELIAAVKDILKQKGVDVQHIGRAIGICKRISCENGGTCTAVRGKGTCHCVPGYEGITCDYKVCDDFRCNNSLCLNSSKQCDGVHDCGDWSDELNCECSPDTKSCNDSSMCIYPTNVCDSKVDCKDLSDEIGCECNFLQYECDGICVALQTWCDGSKDCPISGMDELDCNDTCPPSQHKCASLYGPCIINLWVCDGIPNCYDWSDEMGCEQCDVPGNNMTHCGDPPVCLHPQLWCTGIDYCLDAADNPEGCECRPSQFDCVTGGLKCMPIEGVCDGNPQCTDKRDEWNCECTELQTRCTNGFCKANTAWCDGIDDCGDLSDELGCECSEAQLPCDDGLTCFNKVHWCDGYPHCQDASDEKENCTCLEDQFTCDGFCLANVKKCDGRKDCIDAIDEEDCESECAGFRCTESLECLPASFYRCDGYVNCADHTDEIGCEESCEDRFVCDNGRCLDHSYVCDQYDNCGDNTDERDCEYECLEDEYKCAKGNCIPKPWLCDLIADCDDADDEDQEHCVSCSDDDRPCRGGNTCYEPSQHCDRTEQCPYGEDEYQCIYLDKDSAEDGEALVVKATKEDVVYDGICSDNWSEAWTTAVCTYLSYESGESHTLIDAAADSSLLVPQSSDPTPGDLLGDLVPGNCDSGQMVTIKCISKECGIVPLHSNAFSPYIIHGEDAAPGQWPWQAQLFHDGYFKCGGSIIDHYWLLTASHCVSSNYGHLLPDSLFSVRVGTSRFGVPDPNSRVYKVDKVIMHPGYTRAYYDTDIALVRVSEYIEYTDYIRAVCVADSSYDPREAVECFISGFGADNLQYTLATNLKQAKMDVLASDYCEQVYRDGGGTRWSYGNINVRDGTQICIGFPQKPIGSCFGDSGGPFMCRDQHFHWTQAGISSYGSVCRGLSVYSRVSAFSEWVAQELAQNPPRS